MTSPLTPEQSALAAELALGVLEGAERAEALRLSLADPAFAALVREWQARLDPLGQGFEEAAPPEVWAAIEARLDPQEGPRPVAGIRLWQGLAAASGALAASLAAVLVFAPSPGPTPTPAASPALAARPVIAQLAGADGTLLAASIGPEARYVAIRAVSLPATQLMPELWLIPGDGVPRSLGLIAPAGTTQVQLPPALRALVVDGAVLAVSLEQAQGAPHAAPSSTPIATGKISTI